MIITDSIKLKRGDVVKLRGDNRPDLQLSRIQYMGWGATDEERMKVPVTIHPPIDGKDNFTLGEMEGFCDGIARDAKFNQINIGDRYVASATCRSAKLEFGVVVGFSNHKVAVKVDEYDITHKYQENIFIIK